MILEPCTLASLLEDNQAFAERYKRTALMRLINSTVMTEHDVRERLLDAIQIFSTYFQKTIMLRACFTEPKQHVAIARLHLEEEFGHDTRLAGERNRHETLFDPILEGTTSWFAWQMLAADNLEKHVLVQFVLETSASIFFPAANEVMQRFGQTRYFAIHAEADEHHKSLGMDVVINLRPDDYSRLSLVLERGWKMLFAVCDRVTDIALQA